MLSTLSIVYLFAGGVGAGALCVASCADLLFVKEPFGTRGFGWRSADSGLDAHEPYRRVAARVFLISWALVAFGALCLLADLGRIDRLERLFLAPTASYLPLGAYALAALLAVGAAPVLARLLQLRNTQRSAVAALEIATAVLALVVMTYTGLLLRQMVGVALWATWLTPALFVLSSLSGGCGLVCLVSALAETQDPLLPALAAVLRVDCVVIAAEAVVAALFVARAFSVDNTSMAASRQALFDTSTTVAQLWWVGFVLVGMALPAVLEVISLSRAQARAAAQGAFFRARGIPALTNGGEGDLRRLMAICAAATLVGALCFRFAIAEAGAPRQLELMGDAAVAQVAVAQATSAQTAGEDAATEKAPGEDVTLSLPFAAFPTFATFSTSSTLPTASHGNAR